jgi:hypothetical protein
MTEVRTCSILHLEDDANDALLFKRAFFKALIPCDLFRVDSAQEARCYLLGEDPYSDRERFPLPNLILTNITLRDESALGFVQWVRDQASFAGIAVACLTGSEDPRKTGPFSALGVSVLRKASVFEDTIALIRKVVLP